MIIIDNSILSFAFHLDNGIPILPYYNNKNDRELLYLVHYLGTLVNQPNLSIENRKFIKYNYESNNVNASVIMYENTQNDYESCDNNTTCLDCNISYFSGSESEFEGIKNVSLKNMFKDL